MRELDIFNPAKVRAIMAEKEKQIAEMKLQITALRRALEKTHQWINANCNHLRGEYGECAIYTIKPISGIRRNNCDCGFGSLMNNIEQAIQSSPAPQPMEDLNLAVRALQNMQVTTMQMSRDRAKWLRDQATEALEALKRWTK